MKKKARKKEQAIVEALEAAAATAVYKASRKSLYQTLKNADKRLKAIIQYWKTGKLPAEQSQAEPILGAIPFYCTHPKKIPASVPDSLKLLLKWLVKLRIVPKTTISIADWNILEKKVEDLEATLLVLDQEVAALEDGGDGLFLDGGRGGVARRRDRVLQLGV